MTGIVGSAWAANTVSTRNSQWRKYMTFCVDNELIAVPAEPLTVACFLVFMGGTAKFLTINNYVSAIIRLHDYFSHPTDFRNFFLIQLGLKGLKRQLGDHVEQKVPLSVSQLLSIYGNLDLRDPIVRAMWTALVLSFRTLLRKSNLVPNTSTDFEHVLPTTRRSDDVPRINSSCPLY